MKIIFFSPQCNDGNQQLNELINNFIKIDGLEIYRNIENLVNRLCSPEEESTIVVLFTINEITFQELILIREYLSNSKVILVMHDRKKKSLTNAHKLRPRFITYSDADISNISKVINKMISIETKPAAVNLPDNNINSGV
jgi:hypothetical protein